MHLVRDRAAEFGVRGVDPSALSFDLPTAITRKDGIVDGIKAGIFKALDRNKNITFLTGHAEFTSPVDIRVDNHTIRAEKTILAVGSRTAPVKIPGLEKAGYITNNEALKLETLPQSMIIVGGGYIGVEFAQMYARFGTSVTLLGRSPRIMPKEEHEFSEILADLLLAEGIKVHTATEAIQAGRENDLAFIIARHESTEIRFEAEVILYAAGRTARVEGLGLEQVGVEIHGSFLKADNRLRTTAPNIWSLGDANGGPMFTHRDTYDGPIAALNVVKELEREVDYRVVPRAIFTEPALASVGLGEEEARRQEHDIKVGIAKFSGSGRAKAIGDTEGLVKIIVDAETQEILGGHILGPHADMLIHQIVSAMYEHGTPEPIAKSIHVHPTLSEVVKKAAKAAR